MFALWIDSFTYELSNGARSTFYVFHPSADPMLFVLTCAGWSISSMVSLVLSTRSRNPASLRVLPLFFYTFRLSSVALEKNFKVVGIIEFRTVYKVLVLSKRQWMEHWKLEVALFN